MYLLNQSTSISAIELVKSTSTSSDRPLITYAYFETENARENAEYFIKHAIHDGADFLFILNGETDLYKSLPDLPYVNYVQRKNRCFDLGSQAEVFLSNQGALVKKYKKFIMMNASIRGPFVPAWSDACWSDRYLSKVTDTVKLVGMTYNCKKTEDIPAHLSSMIWATDRIGLQVLLRNGIAVCFQDKDEAINAEIAATKHLKDAGYEVEAMMAAYHSDPNYQQTCNHDDVNWGGAYYGMTMHPFDTMFVKANRNIEEQGLETWTKWYDQMDYNSHDVCGSKKRPKQPVGTVKDRLNIEEQKTS
ncbi:hypothetical protein ABW19_dt0203795 [Dactylella cylindrospora]|nr:hypothetical protein ABW19_dt0203795 [Dactylella cylindrospora]